MSLRIPNKLRSVCKAIPGLCLVLVFGATAAAAAELTLEFRDATTGQLIAVRAGVFDDAGVPVVPPDPEACIFQNVNEQSYFYCDGTITVEPPTANVTVRAGRGFEYIARNLSLTVGADTTVTVELARYVDMKTHNWYSADTAVHILHDPCVYDIPPEKMIELMKAEDLNFVNVTGDRELFTGTLHPASEPDRLLYFSKEQRNAHFSHLTIVGLRQWISDRGCETQNWACGRTLDSWIYEQVHAQGDVLVIVTHPAPVLDVFDLSPWPGGGVWRGSAMDLVSECVDAIDLLCYSNLPPPDGMTDYTHALNAGFRIPPSAGTDATLCRGTTFPPGGYRVYVKPPDGQAFGLESWMEGLRRGRCFVTNYPLFVDFRLDGALPGDEVLYRRAFLEGSVNVVCSLPLESVQIVGNRGVIKTITPEATGDGTIIEANFEIGTAGLEWVAARATGAIDGWHPIDAGGMFAQTGPVYLKPAKDYRGLPVPGTADQLLSFYRREAATYFLGRISDVDSVFNKFGYFPDDSRPAYEAERDKAIEYFQALCPDPPREFCLLDPTDLNWPGNTPVVHTTTPEFRWERTTDADLGGNVTYTLLISTDPGFRGALMFGGLTDTTYALPDSLCLSDQTDYYWRVFAADLMGSRRMATPDPCCFRVDLDMTGLPDPPGPRWAIGSVCPNPFNPGTSIVYTIPKGGTRHSLEIFDARGKRVRTLFDGDRAPGEWTETWNGLDDCGFPVASGVYFLRLTPFGDPSPITRKLVLLK